MKKKILLILAILLFLIFIGWMLRDLFQGKTSSPGNPYDYGIQSLRAEDSVPAYTESMPLKPPLEEITSLTYGQDGKVYIAGKGGVAIMNESGRMIKRFSLSGQPTCLTLSPDGSLVIGMEDHIELWSQNGILIAAWPPLDTNSVITSVATSQNMIFVADAGKKIVCQYDRYGKLLAKIGEKDPVRKIPGFIIPSPYFDVGISPAGELWVANTGRHKLERYGSDGSLLATWGVASMTLDGFVGCCNPSHFTFLPDGSFVTSEKGIERVKLYSPAGKFIALVAGPESFDEGVKGLDLAAGSNNHILVLDPSRNQVRVFLPNEKK